MSSGPGALWTLVLAVLGAALLAGCASPPVLLEESDFSSLDEVVESSHGTIVAPPGWTWCDLNVRTWLHGTPHGSTLEFGGDAWLAATIVDGTATDTSAARTMTFLDELASMCVDRADADRSIETLDGLAEGELGWRTRDVDSWGEYVLVPLDEWRFLAVGFETDQEQPPVDMAELVTLAKAGAARFPVDAG